MTLTLQAYGALTQVLGDAPQSLETTATTAAELLQQLHSQYPDLADWIHRIACAQGDSLLSAHDKLDTDQTVALIPPVSGG